MDILRNPNTKKTINTQNINNTDAYQLPKWGAMLIKETDSLVARNKDSRLPLRIYTLDQGHSRRHADRSVRYMQDEY